MSTKTYQGSCHCGRVRFKADIDLSKGSGRCNCTFCLKARWWGAIIKPEAFTLLSGEDALTDYRSEHNKAGHFFFCRYCGVRPFAKGHVEQLGGDYVTVSLAALDDVPPQELVEGGIRFMNGRDNAWFTPPAFTGHL